MSQFFIQLDSESRERFSMARFFEFTDNFDPLTSFFARELINLPQFGYYTVQGEDGRPDILSHRIYGDTQYWWVLLAYNKILEFDAFVTGQTIRYPSLDSLEELFFSLKARQTTQESSA